MSGDQVIQRCRIEYFQMLIGLNSLQRPTSVPFPSGVDENLRSQVVELRRYVDHLEAERDKERKRSEAMLEVGTEIDAGLEESFVEQEKQKLAENEKMLKRKEKKVGRREGAG